MNIDTRWIEPYMTAGFLIESGETEKAREIYAKMKEDMAAAGEPEKNIRIIDNCIDEFTMGVGKRIDITLDAFRIGGGTLLFLSAVGLVNGKVEDKKPVVAERDDDSEAKISNIAVVPLAIPVTVGPGTIAALLVIGADASTVKTHLLSAGALALALLCLTTILFVATWIEQKLGRHVIVILSKVTGLILAAMASQMIFTGIRSFLVP